VNVKDSSGSDLRQSRRLEVANPKLKPNIVHRFFSSLGPGVIATAPGFGIQQNLTASSRMSLYSVIP